MEQVFSDIEVITDITSILLEKLEERLKQWPTVQKFGDIFRDSVRKRTKFRSVAVH
jgi:hypothetical protein